MKKLLTPLLLSALALASCSKTTDPTPAPQQRVTAEPLLGQWRSSQVRAVVTQAGSPTRDTTTPTATVLAVSAASFALGFQDAQGTNTTSYGWQLQGQALQLTNAAGQARTGTVRWLSSSSFALQLSNSPSTAAAQEVLYITFTR